jgi:hypothetical protein
MTGDRRDELADALAKHGNAVDAVLAESFEYWGIGSSFRLLAAMAREIAAAEKKRREGGQ